MSLREYLYIDEKRLNSYFEQIAAPIKYDKVPIWNVALALVGPRAGVVQSRQGRVPTIHEKLKAVLDYLREQNYLKRGRPLDDEKQPPFRLEICKAKKVFLPPSTKDTGGFQGLTLWVSLTEGEDEVAWRHARARGGMPLYLLEDFPRPDGFFVDRSSAYSMLQSLVRECETEFEQTLLGDKAAKIRSRKEGESFATSPSQLLKRLCRWGARIGAEHTIETLYRVRMIFRESFAQFRRWSTFGYPIYIAEADATETRPHF